MPSDRSVQCVGMPPSTGFRFARMLWHPAVAYGIALLVLASAVLQRRGEVATPAQPAAREATPPASGSAPPTLAPGPPPTLDLRSQSITIPLPQAFGAAAGLEVRIRDETGKRELLQRFDAPTREGVVVAQLPAGWLALGGTWEVELRSIGPATSPVQRSTVQVPHRLRD